MAVLLIAALGGLGLWFHSRYTTSAVMEIPIREFTNAEYPEDPAVRSTQFGRYTGRKLKLVKKDATHFDFIFEPTSEHIAEVAFRDIDVSLMTPSEPDWTKDEVGLKRIALTARQWNRQQVSFDPRSPHVEIAGGNGYEKANLSFAELAKDCLNAGLWEVLLFSQDHGQNAMYYEGWFNFPLGHSPIPGKWGLEETARLPNCHVGGHEGCQTAKLPTATWPRGVERAIPQAA